MMMPVKLGCLDGIPQQYHSLLTSLFNVMESRFNGQIGYLTIDEQHLYDEIIKLI